MSWPYDVEDVRTRISKGRTGIHNEGCTVTLEGRTGNSGSRTVWTEDNSSHTVG